MKATLAKVMPQLLEHEGGYVDNPKDPGGATKYGITKKTLEAWRGRTVTKAEVKALEQDEAQDIYRANYWPVVKGDDLPPGIDYVVFDTAVNSGPDRAIRILQAVLEVTVDGRLGPQTMAAASQKPRLEVIRSYSKRRLAFLEALKTWPTFGKGWKRRVDAVEKLALEIAAGTTPMNPPFALPPEPDTSWVTKNPAPDAAPSREPSPSKTFTTKPTVILPASPVQPLPDVEPIDVVPAVPARHRGLVGLAIVAVLLVVGIAGKVAGWW